MTRSAFGRLPDGASVDLFTLSNGRGVEVRAITYGAILQAIRVPDAGGTAADIALGFDSLAGFLGPTPYFGAIVGRYANRIAQGRFRLDGRIYQLATNIGPNHLHGGMKGFDKVNWHGESFQHGDSVGVSFTRTSRDGEEGYPGTLSVRVTYTLTAQSELLIDYLATTDKATPINLSQHTYFNLRGEGSGDILGHLLRIAADSITLVDAAQIPTGAIAPVAGTPFDFRTATAIGARIDAPDPQLRHGGGYDHNFVLTRAGPSPGLVHAAHVSEPTSGRTLDVFTTEPGVQFYSGNFLDGTVKGKSGHAYPHRGGLCLETQHYPDSPNHPNFPSTILQPGTEYRSRTVWVFGAGAQ